MTFPLPMAVRLQCKSCDNFQGDTGAKDASGFPTQGKCRLNTPDPVLADTLDSQVSNWGTVLETDVCSQHRQYTVPVDSDYKALYQFLPTNPRAPVSIASPSEVAVISFQTIQKPVVNLTCGMCEFWKDSDTTCHRVGPKPAAGAVEASKSVVWLTTQTNDWCAFGVPNEAKREAILATATNVYKTIDPN